ncbi:MAG TPA: 2'-deoxycytidine 5'-triphosphate deaminase [Dehalococcoidia bacterium]|nr:2'-deoxycytidine 5'-triphosphate deaminase [Dehalococcoidia bacterium]
MRSGVFPSQQLRQSIQDGWIVADGYEIRPEDIQPASLDLHLGDIAHRLQCSFIPGESTVQDKLAEYVMGSPIDLREGAVLEIGRPYLIPLAESLALPSDVRARTNPKSSTGRLDVFTRVITDHGNYFDDVAAGYKGGLYLEVFSRSFTIRVKQGFALNQLRLLGADTEITDNELRVLHEKDPLIFLDSGPAQPGQVTFASGLLLSVDLSSISAVAYRARKNSKLLDLTLEGFYDYTEFWEAERPTGAPRRLILEPEEFYLLVSKERVRVPPDYAAEMVAYDPTSGELRTHYAGFFDPGFGDIPGAERQGSRAVLEVRAHDVPFVIEDGQKVFKLAFQRLAERPDVLYGDQIGSHYQGQELSLSKQFRQPEA